MRISAKVIWRMAAFLLAVFDTSIGVANHLPGTLHRQLRELKYPDDSEMGMFFALAVPLDDPDLTKAVNVAFFFEANYRLVIEESEEKEAGRSIRNVDENTGIFDRRTVYRMLEAKFKDFGLPGRACLIRFICETSRYRIHEDNGVIGDLLRILLTPSSSADEGLPVEYRSAEDTPDDCGTTYSLCPVGIYDYITLAESE